MGKIKNIPFRVFCYVLMIVFLFIYLFPLFFVANTSLKTSQDYMLHPTSLTTTWAACSGVWRQSSVSSGRGRSKRSRWPPVTQTGSTPARGAT